MPQGDQTAPVYTANTSKMTPSRAREFATYANALRAVFEINDHAVPIRVAMQRKGEDKACAFAIVVLPDDMSENGRMALLSEIGRNILPAFGSASLVMPPEFSP